MQTSLYAKAPPGLKTFEKQKFLSPCWRVNGLLSFSNVLVQLRCSEIFLNGLLFCPKFVDQWVSPGIPGIDLNPVEKIEVQVFFIQTKRECENTNKIQTLCLFVSSCATRELELEKLMLNLLSNDNTSV